MSKKSISLIFFICLVLAFAVILLLALTPAVSDPVNDNEDNVPSSYPTGGNKIDIFENDEDLIYGEFAVINADDTLAISNGEEDPVVISIEHKNWKKIKWSPNGNLISVLGENNEGIANLYIYNLKTKNWREVTNFAESGVNNYVWADSDIIFFTQGENPDKWLYKYSYQGGTQSLKVVKVNGDIEAINTDKTKLILKNTGSEEIDYQFAAISGDEFYRLTYWKLGGEFLNPNHLVISNDDSKLALADSENNIYKSDFGSEEAVELGVFAGFRPLCAVTADVFLSYKIDSLEEIIYLSNLNIRTETDRDVAFIRINDIDEVIMSQCFDVNRILIGIRLSDETIKWYKLDSTNELIELEFLNSSKEISFRD